MPLLTTEWINEREWRLVHPIAIGPFVVPAGFVTDFASVPRAFWSLAAPTGKHTLAALLHDYLYRDQPPGITRQMADRWFLREMEKAGVARPKRWAMYRAVRLFGGSAWKTRCAKSHSGPCSDSEPQDSSP